MNGTRRRRWQPALLVQVLAIVVVGALPGLVLSDVVAERRSVVAAAAVAAAAAAVASICASARLRRVLGRWPVTALVLTAGGAGAALLVTVAWPDPSRPNAVRSLGDAVVGGWAELVTTAVPAPGEPRTLVPLTLVTWFGVAVGVTLALRTNARLAPLLPPLAGVVLTTMAAGEHQAAPAVTGATVVVAGGLFLAARLPAPAATQHPAAAARRPAVATVVVAALAAAIAAAAGPALAAGRDADPFDPRDHLNTPLLPADAESPLDLVAAWLQSPNETIFTVRTADPAQPLRLVALDVFDGATWTISGTWVRAGTSLGAPDQPALTSRSAAAEVRVVNLDQPWLPSFGAAPQVAGTEAIVHPPSGSVAVAEGSADGAEYTVTADVLVEDERFATLLAAVAPAADAAGRAATELPAGLPDYLGEMAEAATADAGDVAFVQATALARYLKFNFAFDPDLRGGHSYGHLLRAFAQDGVGTSEQFATAFAVMGREVGLPTRVVVGFRPGAEVAPGTFAVRSGDVEVWPEVRFDGIGWIRFDPTPVPEADAVRPEEEPITIGDQEVILQPASPTDTRPSASAGDDRPAAGADDGDKAWTDSWPFRLAVLAVVLSGATVVLTMIGIVFLKRRRTAQRRRAATAQQRTVGAWHDVLDRLVEDGAEPGRRTVEENVASVEPPGALLGIYRPTTRALYGLAGAVSDAEAEQAWRSHDSFVGEVRRHERFGRRLRRALDPRPLRVGRARPDGPGATTERGTSTGTVAGPRPLSSSSHGSP